MLEGAAIRLSAQAGPLWIEAKMGVHGISGLAGRPRVGVGSWRVHVDEGRIGEIGVNVQTDLHDPSAR
jgi:hypothetical protein